MLEQYRVGKMVDVRNREIKEDQLIVVRDGRVESISPAKSASTSADVIDLREHLVTPGLIDLHTHLIGDLDNGSYNSFLTKSAGWAILRGVKNAKTTLQAGFTSVRDLGTFRAFLDCDLRDAIEEGVVQGPRMFTTGGYVTSTTGGGEITDLPVGITLPEEFRVGVADSPAEVRKAVRRLIHGGSDLIKVIATGAGFAAGTVPGAPEFSQEEIRAAVEEAALYGKHVAAHAHGTLGAIRAIRAGVRTLDHGSYISGDEVFEAMLEHGTIYVPTTYLIHWLDDQGDSSGFPPEVRRKVHQAVDLSIDALAEAYRRGITIAYGTDAIVFPHGENAKQMEDFEAVGMSAMETLVTATLNAAHALGSDDVGVLEPGRFADFIALKDVDAVTDVRDFQHVSHVFKGGVEVSRA